MVYSLKKTLLLFCSGERDKTFEEVPLTTPLLQSKWTFFLLDDKLTLRVVVASSSKTTNEIIAINGLSSHLFLCIVKLEPCL